MSRDLTRACDDALSAAVGGAGELPGVVAVVVDRQGLRYAGAAGVRRAGDDGPMTPDSVLAAFSTTKAMTATAVLALAEAGRLDLDAPAADHVPELDGLGVLTGFADDGPVTRPPARPVTTRHLLQHTAGFGYDFFDERYARLTREFGVPPVASATAASLSTPLLFDPGQRWLYGSSSDWAGRVVEAVTGTRLRDAMRELVLDPLGLADTGFVRTPSMRTRAASLHKRRRDGGVVALGADPASGAANEPELELDMGGQGLFTTALDYGAFLSMWLADGAGPNGRVLSPETVGTALRGGPEMTPLPSAHPGVTHALELYPGVRTTWAPLGMVTADPVGGGRAAGSVGWAGLANLYWWVDRRSGVAGFWATQLFPFLDPSAFAAAHTFEAAVYANL